MNRNTQWMNFMETLKSKLDIVDVVSGYVSLQKKGGRFWACCPIHHEKTPSFTVNEHMQSFKCFGCGESGDIIKFVQKMENLEFMPAVEMLANKVGVEMPKFSADKGLLEKKQKKEKMLAICLEAAKFYRKNLLAEGGQVGLKYLQDRGFSNGTITKFGFGMSPDFNALATHLRSTGHDIETAVECGILDRGQESGRTYDAQAKRVVVPIISAMGEVIAFGGRTLEQNPDFAKYKNTKSTMLFDKSKTLFGINLISKLKRQQKVDSLIFVEGYMDAISLHQQGIENVVASMGTALTKEQAKLAKRYVDKVYIAFDGDSAGTKGTLRGLDALVQEGLSVKVVVLPNGMDPDETVQKFGVKKFNDLLEEALSLVDYKLHLAKIEHNFADAPPALVEEERRAYTNMALGILSKVDNLVEGESFLKKVSKETGFSLDWLKTALVKKMEGVEVQQMEQPAMPTVSREKKVLFEVLAHLLSGQAYAKIDSLPNCYDDEFLIKSFEYVLSCQKEGKKPMASLISDIVGEGFDKEMEILNAVNFTTTIQNQKTFDDCMKYIKTSDIKKQIDQLQVLYEQEGDSQRKSQIAMEISALLRQKKG